MLNMGIHFIDRIRYRNVDMPVAVCELLVLFAYINIIDWVFVKSQSAILR